MTLVRLDNVDKYYAGNEILKEINLQIQKGDRWGLIGKNGVGKTTLLEIIKGEKDPDRGRVERNRNFSLGFLPQTLSWAQSGKVDDYLWQAFSKELKLRAELEALTEKISWSSNPELLENYAHLQERYEEEGGYQCESRIRGIINGLGFLEDALQRDLNSFSGGEKTRLALARLLLEKPDLLLLDEPTNHLDRDNREWLADFMEDYPGALVIVSHDRYFLDRVVKGIWEIEDFRLYSYPGNYSNYKEQRELKVKTWEREYEKQQEEIESLKEFIRKYKAGQRTREARAREKRLERMEIIPPPPPPRKKLRLRFPLNKISGKEVLKIKDFSCEREGKTLFSKVQTSVERGERILLLGPNGAGKTSFLKGLLTETSEKISWGHNVELGYFDQEGGDLPGEKTLIQVVADFGLSKKQDIMDHLGAFRFGGEEAEKKVSMLSGGELARLNLALLVLKGANVLLMDEPTNHLDLDLQEWLEEALQAFSGTLIFISHDRYFIESLTTRIWHLQDGKFTDFQGSYKEFLQKEKDREKAAKNARTKKISRPKKKKSSPSKKEQKEKQRKELEEKISGLEEEIEEYNKLFSDPDFFKKEDAPQIMAEYEKKKKELEHLFSNWEEIID